MKRTAGLIVLVVLIFGCAYPYTSPYLVKNHADEFTDPAANLIFRSMVGNHIYERDPMGLVPFSELNIDMGIHKKSNKIVASSLFLKNVRSSGRGQSSPLYIKDGDKLIIITDSARITLAARYTKSYSKSEILMGRLHYTYFDLAHYAISKDDLKKIADAKNIKFRVTGSEGMQDYSVVNETFLPNLSRFYVEEISNRQIATAEDM
jgi:hypothetical protein